MIEATDTVPLGAIAAHGLPGTFHVFPVRPLADAEWSALRSGARQQRLTGLLLAAVDDDAMPATREQRDDVVEDLTHQMAGALLLEDLLLSVVAALDRAGVPHRVMKGCAVAHLDYPSPDQRIFGDLDVMVPSAGFDTAVAVLSAEGHARPFTAPRAGWERRFGKGASFTAVDGREIDLHRTFCTGPYAVKIRLDDVWSAPGERYTLAGQQLEALPRELRLLNAAYGAILGDRTAPAPTLRDIAMLALHPDLDTSEVLGIAQRWGSEAVLAAAVTAAWQTLRIGDVTALSTWAGHYRPTAREAKDLALYHADDVTETVRALATAQAIPNLATRGIYLWGLARANPQFAARSKRGPVRRILHGVSRLRQIRHSS
jgi:hypothetical protein